MGTYYRVENDQGNGPYQDSAGTFRSYMGLAHSFDSAHPSPFRSGYSMRMVDYCAFNNMQDLFRWFGGWLPTLIQNGYRVVKVTGKLCFDDGYQVVIRDIIR